MIKKTSEELLDIANPPEYQCPNIDKYILMVNNIEGALEEADDIDDIDEIKSFINNINCDVGDIETQFEELRDAMHFLRMWGQEWKDIAKALIERYEPERLQYRENEEM